MPRKSPTSTPARRARCRRSVCSSWRNPDVSDRRLVRLARLHGIQPSWRDARDVEHQVSPETLRAVLAALGVASDSSTAIDTGLAEWRERTWRSALPKSLVAGSAAPLTVDVVLPEHVAGRIRYTLTLEDRGTATGDVPSAACATVGRNRTAMRV